MEASLLGIDFGTSNTVAVLHRNGQGVPLLFEGSPLLPSAVFVDPGHGLLVGRDAERAAGSAPANLDLNPKRRIDEQTVWLGEQEITVPDLIAAVLHRVGGEAQRVLGHAPERVVLTYPAGWGGQRLQVLTDAAGRAGLGTPQLMPEPAAAAWYFITTLGRLVAPGRCVVVYDFGAGTFDVAVLRRSPQGFDVLASEGLADLGGLDLDAAVVNHLRTLTPHAAAAWGQLDWPQTAVDRRARKQLWDEVRAAKEQLSRHPTATLHVPLVEADLHVTREEFERLARPLLARTVATTVATLRSARITPDAVAGVFLVGGSSRIPLAGQLLHQELGIAPTVMEQPELVVASGAGSPQSQPLPAPQPVPQAAPAPAPSPQPVAAPVTPAPMPSAPVSTSPGFAPVSTPPVSSPVTGAPFSAPPSFGGPPTYSGFQPAFAAATPEPGRRSPLLIVAGVLAVLGTVLSTGFPLLDQFLHVAFDNWAVSWGFDRDASGPHIFLANTVYLLAEFAVIVVALVAGVRAGPVRWLGGGLLVGLGLANLGQGIYQLAHPNLVQPDFFFDRTWVFGLGNAVVALAAVLAFVAVLLGRPEATIGRPPHLAWSVVLVVLGVATSGVYLGVQFIGRSSFEVLPVLWTVLVALACLTMPAWAAFARPTPLAAGLFAGLLSTILPTGLDLTVYWDLYGTGTRWGLLLYFLLGVAMLAVGIPALRGRTAARAVSAPNAQYGTPAG